MTDKKLPQIDRRSESVGLGDTIKKVTDALHIPQCGACKKRQEKLNRLFPYKEKPKTKE
jgi:hypothetical protein